MRLPFRYFIIAVGRASWFLIVLIITIASATQFIYAVPTVIKVVVPILGFFMAIFLAFHQIKRGKRGNIKIMEHQFDSPTTLRLLVKLKPQENIKIEAVKLSLKGNPIPANNFKPYELEEESLPTYFYFNIPNSVTPGEHPVQLIVVTDIEKWCSNKHRITFPQ